MTLLTKALCGALLALAGLCWYFQQRNEVLSLQNTQLTAAVRQAKAAKTAADKVAKTHQYRASALEAHRLKESHDLDKAIAQEPVWASQPVPPAVLDALGLRNDRSDVPAPD